MQDEDEKVSMVLPVYFFLHCVFFPDFCVPRKSTDKRR